MPVHVKGRESNNTPPQNFSLKQNTQPLGKLLLFILNETIIFLQNLQKQTGFCNISNAAYELCLHPHWE